MSGYAVGDRVEMIHQPDDPHPIEPGTLGTVSGTRSSFDTYHQLDVDWDNGRTLAVVLPVDQIRRAES